MDLLERLLRSTPRSIVTTSSCQTHLSIYSIAATPVFEHLHLLCFINFYFRAFVMVSCGAMVARLTSNQKAAGSSPAMGIFLLKHNFDFIICGA